MAPGDGDGEAIGLSAGEGVGVGDSVLGLGDALGRLRGLAVGVGLASCPATLEPPRACANMIAIASIRITDKAKATALVRLELSFMKFPPVPPV